MKEKKIMKKKRKRELKEKKEKKKRKEREEREENERKEFERLKKQQEEMELKLQNELITFLRNQVDQLHSENVNLYFFCFFKLFIFYVVQTILRREISEISNEQETKEKQMVINSQ